VEESKCDFFHFVLILPTILLRRLLYEVIKVRGLNAISSMFLHIRATTSTDVRKIQTNACPELAAKLTVQSSPKVHTAIGLLVLAQSIKINNRFLEKLLTC